MLSYCPLPTTPQGWEALWAPYDEPTYQQVLDALQPDDIVLDIGAGDLRLARRMAVKVRQVLAVECQRELLYGAAPLPDNLLVVCADARNCTFPTGLTAAVLLMRHCTTFSLYASRLLAAGARRLITNARWGMGVEVVDLQAPRCTYSQAPLGWYACWCGAVGFKPGSLETYTATDDQRISEISYCPACSGGG